MICMPEGAPISKVEATRNYGAEVVLVPGVTMTPPARPSVSPRSTATPSRIPSMIRMSFRSGTIGLEILEQLPEVEQVVVPIGGGGLISGVAFAIKQLKPPARSSECRPALWLPCMLPVSW